VGKSRLVYEFSHSHRQQGWLVLESASVSYGKATSYLPVIDFLKTYFQVQDRGDNRDIREKITGKLLALDRALVPVLPAFLGLLDVPVEDSHWEALDPPQKRQRTLEAVKQLLLRESQVRPLLLLLEDLHCLRSNIAVLEGELQSARFGIAGLPSVFSRCFLVWSLAELGGFPEGTVRGEEAVHIAETADHPYSLAMARFTAGYLHLRTGELDRAVGLLEPGLALCRAVEMPALLTQLLATLGYARVLQGRVAEGQTLLEESVEPSTFSRSAPFSFPLLFLGEATFLARKDSDAAQIGRRALDQARARRERGWEAWALRLLAETAMHRDPPEIESAEQHLHQAFALTADLGMRPLIAHCHLGLGKLYRRTDKREQAQEHLATATTMYREMGMAYWLEKAEAQLAELER
jgi:tetratricopeptide (TPR) repeat protein